MIQLNVTALTTLTRLLLPKMLEQKSGKILNVASTAAFQPGPFMAVYFATKAYVLSLSEALATELFKGVVMDARTVAETGYNGMIKNKRIIIPSWRNKILVQLLRVSPRTFTAKVMRRILM